MHYYLKGLDDLTSYLNDLFNEIVNQTYTVIIMILCNHNAL